MSAAATRSAIPEIAKFGGSSFRTPEDYGDVAEHLLQRRQDSGPIVAVVSAMPGETEVLRQRLHQVNPAPRDRNTAGLVTLADVISAQLLASAIDRLGGRAIALVGHQNGITTDDRWMWARVRSLDPEPVLAATADHDVVVVPGGPASDESRNPTWMGKNSSDLAAVSLAKSIGRDECDIHSDVPGIYSADPALVPDAELIPEVSYGFASLLSMRGARVLHHRSVEMAKQAGVRVRCRLNAANYQIGTTMRESAPITRSVIIDLTSTLISFDGPGEADRVHETLASSGLQTVRPADLPEPLVVVTGGFVDVETTLKNAGLPGKIRQGRLVSRLEGLQLSSHLAENDESAIELGRKLHAETRA